MPAKSILILNNLESFKSFHETLCDTLYALRCKPLVFTKWPDSTAERNQMMENQKLLLIDPTLPLFNPNELHELLLSFQVQERPKVITIRVHPDDDLSKLDRDLDAEGFVAKSYTQHEMAFVLNRFLYPEQQNRRKYPRMLASFPVEYVSGEGHVRAKCFNVSTGGMFIRSYKPEHHNKLMEFRLHLPDGKEAAACPGRVIFNKAYKLGSMGLHPAGMGVQFETISEAAQERLHAFISPRLLRADQRS